MNTLLKYIFNCSFRKKETRRFKRRSIALLILFVLGLVTVEKTHY